ncbi:ATP-binding cassette domain-containing protein [Alteromonas sp. C1M14]|uniref:ATP-binding cassette domain-containing protein n=1 Tax=Alteromonas sp. C1M14 TaxID=2841567 RepID=UPI001C0A1480|nr:ATP-binding cassette domain-containing protein [Alteromonas sp. C1M14]MBU2978157.1 ATP-binding cassette domain-containing protein [Alteromonas sp. C1M14]
MSLALQVTSLSYAYQKHKVLKDVSLQLEKGKFYGLLGPNGAGKSTLFSLLSQLLSANDGDISVNGYDIKSAPRKALASMGIVFQQSTLDTDLTVRQNLQYHASLHGLSSKVAEQNIARELVRFSLEQKQHEKIRNLNGGHRRRVEIARALLHDPAILLLDEASVGLDMPTRDSINEHIRYLCKERRITVLSSTHLVDEIQTDDHLILLHNGKILLDAPCASALLTHQFNDVKTLYRQLIAGDAQ